MKKIRKYLPFDKKNEEDFIKITENIQIALNVIRNDPKIPATQNKLAKLANCSRKTLYNREGVIKELKLIKSERKFAKSKHTDNIIDFSRKDNDKTKEILIKKYEHQNALLFDKIQDLEEQVKELSDINIVLNEDKQVLLAENTELRSKLRKSKNTTYSSSNVVHIKQ